MEADLYVPEGTDIEVVMREYPDLYEDEGWGEGVQHYCIGNSMDEEDHEWMTYDDAVRFCGFCEGAIDDSQTVIEGNGEWAQSMLRRTDFSGLAVSDETKQEWQGYSELYWEAHKRGLANKLNRTE